MINVCSVTSCDRPSRARGLCHTHYERIRRGVPKKTALKPIRRWELPVEQLILIRMDMSRDMFHRALAVFMNIVWSWRSFLVENLELEKVFITGMVLDMTIGQRI